MREELYRRMPEGTLHLSRMMCSAHIMEVIKLIKQKLKDNEPVRVISTQLVEAGVDIDFPVVYRAFAGLDSIIQAAGRCNREGKLNHVGKLGQVFVFNLENTLLRGLMGKGAAALREILSVSDGSDLFSPECMAQYFSLFYSNCNTFDKANIKGLLYKGFAEMHFMFATAAEKFRLIDDKDSVSILVGYGDGATLLEELKRIGPEFWLLRKLQQYSVSIRKWDFEDWCGVVKSSNIQVYSFWRIRIAMICKLDWSDLFEENRTAVYCDSGNCIRDCQALSFIVRIMLARTLSPSAMNYYTLAAPTMVFFIHPGTDGNPRGLIQGDCAKRPSPSAAEGSV